MEYTKYKQKLAPIRNVKPYKANEKINFNTNTKNKNMTLIFNNKTKSKIPFEIKKNKFQNQTFIKKTEKEIFPKIKFSNTRKKNVFQPRLFQINSQRLTKLNKNSSASQDNINILSKEKKFMTSFSSKIEKSFKKNDTTLNEDYDTDIENININEYIEKIKDDFKDNGKVIKIKFEVDKDRIYEYQKNEFVILKIFENDLKQNQGLDIKEFTYNNRKLNMYNSLKDENIENNSVIKVII